MSAALAWREQVAAALVCGSSSCVSLFIGWFQSWRGEFDIDIKADRAYDRPLPCCLLHGSFSLKCPRLRRYVDRHGRCQEVVPFSARYDTDSGCNARAPGRWLETHGGIESSAR